MAPRLRNKACGPWRPFVQPPPPSQFLGGSKGPAAPNSIFHYSLSRGWFKATTSHTSDVKPVNRVGARRGNLLLPCPVPFWCQNVYSHAPHIHKSRRTRGGWTGVGAARISAKDGTAPTQLAEEPP